MKMGDLVFLFRGLHDLLGVALITGDYRFDPTRSAYAHRRGVEFLAVGTWKVPESLRGPTKTLTLLDDDGRRRSLLEIAGSIPTR